MPFKVQKVNQDHRGRYQLKAHIRLPIID